MSKNLADSKRGSKSERSANNSILRKLSGGSKKNDFEDDHKDGDVFTSPCSSLTPCTLTYCGGLWYVYYSQTEGGGATRVGVKWVVGVLAVCLKRGEIQGRVAKLPG